MAASEKQEEMLNKVDLAIANLRRGKKKISISKIAQKSKIARKTIYNHPELKERCEQAIKMQEESSSLKGVSENSTIQIENKPLSGRKLIEERYRKSRENLKLEQEKNAKLLENNRQLVLEKAELKNRIVMLQNQIQQIQEQKIISYN